MTQPDDLSNSLERWETQLRKGGLTLAVLASLWEGRLYGLDILRRLQSSADLTVSEGAIYQAARGITAREIRDAVTSAFGELVPVERARDAGPARGWALARDPRREVGIISAMTEHFCDDCNRLRLTATGDLHACLGHDDATSLRDLVRAGASDQDLSNAIGAAVTGKAAGHTFSDSPPSTHMIGIGG